MYLLMYADTCLCLLTYLYGIRNTLLTKAQSLNIKVDKDYEIVHERMT